MTSRLLFHPAEMGQAPNGLSAALWFVTVADPADTA